MESQNLVEKQDKNTVLKVCESYLVVITEVHLMYGLVMTLPYMRYAHIKLVTVMPFFFITTMSVLYVYTLLLL